MGSSRSSGLCASPGSRPRPSPTSCSPSRSCFFCAASVRRACSGSRQQCLPPRRRGPWLCAVSLGSTSAPQTGLGAQPPRCVPGNGRVGARRLRNHVPNLPCSPVTMLTCASRVCGETSYHELCLGSGAESPGFRWAHTKRVPRRTRPPGPGAETAGPVHFCWLIQTGAPSALGSVCLLHLSPVMSHW